MDVTYKFRADAAYYRTLIDRYYQQRPFLLSLMAQFGLLALIIAGAFLSTAVAPIGLKVGIALIIAALIFFGGVAFTKWGVYQRLKHRADFGMEATVTMSAGGLVASGPRFEGKWNWAAYPRAVRYSDGILLLRRGVIRWLPDSALVVGTPTDATALTRSKSALRELA
jgi:cation transport ATPase